MFQQLLNLFHTSPRSHKNTQCRHSPNLLNIPRHASNTFTVSIHNILLLYIYTKSVLDTKFGKLTEQLNPTEISCQVSPFGVYGKLSCFQLNIAVPRANLYLYWQAERFFCSQWVQTYGSQCRNSKGWNFWQTRFCWNLPPLYSRCIIKR